MVACYDVLHLVSAHHMLVVASESTQVDIMQLLASYAVVVCTYVLNKLDDHLLCKTLLLKRVLVLIIGLPALAKQLAEKAHGLTLYLLCCKLFYCLAPDFFLIGMLKVFSARSIITSLA